MGEMYDLLAWLNVPLDPGRAHGLEPLASWHARLMVLCWGVVAPVAVLTARYFKITPGQDWPRQLDNPFWWHLHLRGQTLVLVFSVLALGFILAASGTAPAAPTHRLLGWAVLIFAALQGLSGLLRGTKGGPTAPAPDGTLSGDHYDMTRRRLVFETVHKSLGYALLTAAAGNTLLGLWAVNAPRWMWLLIPGWWACLAATGIWLQRTRGAYDTYQAIWGPDAIHPGNRMKKQGWGTVRPGDLPRFRGPSEPR